jgi:hypothetical protein
VEVRNPKWTSYGALEVDVFSKSRADFLVFEAVIEPVADVEFSRDLNEAPHYQSKDQLIQEARAYFNVERYWECHETLEAVWRTITGEEKLFVQGVILICAAFIHHQKGEDEVALNVMRRAVKHLLLQEKSYHGIEVDSLRSEAEIIMTKNEFRTFII